MPGAIFAETLRVWLISKEMRKLPHKARKLIAPNLDIKCPVPVELTLPCLNGEAPKTYRRLFALINGGEDARVICVYYFERE